VWGLRGPLLCDKSLKEAEDLAGVTETDGGGGLVLVTWWHLAFACREPWWRAQDGDQKRLGG